MGNYSTKETILHLDKIEAGYNGKTIIKDITLTEMNVIREGHDATGQTIAFLGRSGRGKSTLFKLMTGLLKPISGTALINDMATDATDDAKIISEGDIGFVDQKYTLFRHKTVTQICQFALRKSKLTKEEKEILINKYLNEWGLLEHKNKYSCELSGGQRQRTAIIEQLLSDKHFMIFDEPFSGLDVGNIEKVKQAFNKIQTDNEMNTIMFSTHDIRLAVELADSIYVIGHADENATYSTIIKHYDLKQMGIAWTAYGDAHRSIVADIKETLLRS